MDKRKHDISDLDDLCFRLECGVAVVDAVHDAMAEGPFTPEVYVDALFGACLFLRSLQEEFRTEVDGRSEGKKVKMGGQRA